MRPHKTFQPSFQTFDQAYEECREKGMSLLTVSSQEEQKMVYNKLLVNIQQPTAFWISLKRGQGDMGEKVLRLQVNILLTSSGQEVFVDISSQRRATTLLSD